MPALPGRQKDSLDTVFTANGKPGAQDTAQAVPLRPSTSDADWEATGKASGPLKSTAGAKPDQPTIELQTYRLDKTREELFEDVFKRKPPPLPTSVEVTLLVDGKSYGTLVDQLHQGTEALLLSRRIRF